MMKMYLYHFESIVLIICLLDYSVAQGNFQWSFPTYPSHIDHILVSSELFDNVYNTEVLLIDQWFFDGFSDYNLPISDHRPIVLQFVYYIYANLKYLNKILYL